GENGLPGWEIDLDYNNDGTTDLKATTDAAGNYSFGRLTDGFYKLTEVQQKGWVQTVQPKPNPVQMTGELPITGQDFGNFKLVSVSGHKFQDTNGNGVQDAGEGPLSGITIQLFQVLSTGGTTLLATTTTDLSGNYIFTNLGPLTPPIGTLGPITLR